MADLRLERVTKVYGDDTVALHELDLDIPDEKLFVLLGPSGCGKTTLLRLIAGLEMPTDGAIWIGDRDVTEDPPKKRDVAMVFQSYALYPHMTVYENIAFGLKSRRMDKKEIGPRVRRTARILGLEDVLKKRPSMLSGGQRQRVAMGRAIVREPAVFLMDEPLSNLDAKMRASMRAEITKIQRAIGTTTVYVTHDQLEAMTLGDVVGVMRDGRLQQVATPHDLYARPRNLFVAGFIGTPPMNLVEATVEREDGLVLAFGPHRVPLDLAGVQARPGVTRYEGRQIVVGIRPEDLRDARVTGARATILARVAHRETMGPDVYVHFDAGAPLLMLRDPREVDPQVETEDEEWAAERANRFIARLDERSTVAEGEEIGLAVPPERIHLFDAVTGDAITD
jgi:multiple sugar transport system ATP-binding protein